MPKKGWNSEKCRYCSKLIKFNAKYNGACKVQLQTHEESCALKHNQTFTKPVDNYIINDNILNVRVKSIKKRITSNTNVNNNQSNTGSSNSANINNVQNNIQNIQSSTSQSSRSQTNNSRVIPLIPLTNNNNLNNVKNLKLKPIKYYSFEDLPKVWLWFCANDIWYPYSLEIQNHINICIENNEKIIFNYFKTSTFNNKEQCITIELDIIKNFQKVTHVDYLDYYSNSLRPIKLINMQNNKNICKINQNLENSYYSNKWVKSNLYRDPIQNIQYTFSRIEINQNNWDSINIPINNNPDELKYYNLIKLINEQDSNIKIKKIFQMQNISHSEQFKKKFESIHSNYCYNLKTGYYEKKPTYNKTKSDIKNENEKKINIAKNIVSEKFVNKLNMYNTGLMPFTKIAFHGVFQAENINNICQEGFEPMLHNKCLYGTGTYFADNVKYVNQNGYSANLGKNLYHLFICKICPGSYCDGQNMQKIPNKLFDTKRFQSFVNDMVRPTIWSIRDKSQIEILYEIHYTINSNDEMKYDLKELYVPNAANNIGII